MSHNPIRADKTCLNCKHVVSQRFCPNCGQENTETRHSFHHLFVHFIEDLTHYENSFWKTIRYLMTKPARLTKEYVAGKRLSYVAPVKLYIFISFVTFLIISLFPTSIDSNLNSSEKEEAEALIRATKNKTINLEQSQYLNLMTMKELDSIQKFAEPQQRYSDTEYYIYSKMIAVTEKYTTRDILIKFTESFTHNLPKILFIIMPLFAFFLWLIHDKKKWYYFDHGIFTLHFFSFILLLFLILFLFNKAINYIQFPDSLSFLTTLVNLVGFGWLLIYFYPAHYYFYEESRTKSFLKSLFLSFVNFVFILILLGLYVFYTFINLH